MEDTLLDGAVVKELVNQVLVADQEDVSINSVEYMSESFVYNKLVLSKTYCYVIMDGLLDDMEEVYLRQACALRLQEKLDRQAIRDSISPFEGTHCFERFTMKRTGKYAIRHVDRVTVTETRLQCREAIEIRFEGKGFMKYQVRMMVGALVDVGLGKISRKELKEMIKDEGCEDDD